ncbi:MAG: dienelactone hydrolase family protein [Caldilineaceae bacterium]|nr:dienelactone hydrolase family protein [Caldilineaceae bacterium]
MLTEAVPTGEGVGSPGASLTTAAGLVTGIVEYPGPDGETLTGYWAHPEAGGPWSAVIVLQEWWGLNEHIYAQ